MDCPVQLPFISMQMVGRHIVIIIGIPEDNEDNGQDNIFVYDFISDVLLMAFRTPKQTYRSIVFLDENYILFPNIQEGSLDIFRIPLQSTFEPVAPFISLDLPILQTRFSYHSILGVANPKPLSEHSYAEMDRRFCQGPRDSLRYTLHPERGYFKRAEDSLCVFTVRVETAQDSRNTPSQIVEEFTFVVHRSALLEIVAEYEERPSPTSRPRPPPHTWPDYLGLPMHEPLTSRTHMDFETGHIRREEDSGYAFWSVPRAHHPLSWENWGPRITRWFNDSNLAPGDVTRGWGERCVRLAPRARPNVGPQPEGIPYLVIDFFRSNRNIARLRKVPVRFRFRDNAPPFCQKIPNFEYGYAFKFLIEVVDFTPPGCMDAMEAPTYLINRVFLHPVISTLPYYYRASVERVKWGRVLIDDQMIVGLHVSNALSSPS
ncbi:hypothetical protein BJ912DRAFT_960192 [Pholiota molesta]|nr:hypothetical protein BJ912DRAFT_960192 [Pholiota molesta]